MAYNVTWPNAEHHEILPGLFLGGHLWEEDGLQRHGRHSSLWEDTSWDYVVSAYLDNENEESFPQCDMRLVLFDDTESGLSEETWEKIRSAVDEVVYRWRKGQKVLVRCQAGYNRSGMMMSLVLMRLGYRAKDAISILRRIRGKDVLVNSAFEGYVHQREGEYRYPQNLAETETIAGNLLAVLND